ncbi:hypothetical protein DFH09DRAFT_1105045 [Mycena vulgaris]|nr:hypothetical protein DFH09DRAFT_1105045 [Mycena vulgaris]
MRYENPEGAEPSRIAVRMHLSGFQIPRVRNEPAADDLLKTIKNVSKQQFLGRALSSASSCKVLVTPKCVTGEASQICDILRRPHADRNPRQFRHSKEGNDLNNPGFNTLWHVPYTIGSRRKIPRPKITAVQTDNATRYSTQTWDTRSNPTLRQVQPSLRLRLFLCHSAWFLKPNRTLMIQAYNLAADLTNFQPIRAVLSTKQRGTSFIRPLWSPSFSNSADVNPVPPLSEFNDRKWHSGLKDSCAPEYSPRASLCQPKSAENPPGNYNGGNQTGPAIIQPCSRMRIVGFKPHLSES